MAPGELLGSDSRKKRFPDFLFSSFLRYFLQGLAVHEHAEWRILFSNCLLKESERTQKMTIVGLQREQEPTYLCKRTHARRKSPGRGCASHTCCAASHQHVPHLPCNCPHPTSLQPSALFIPTSKNQKPDSEFIYPGVIPELLLWILDSYPLSTPLQTQSSRS